MPSPAAAPDDALLPPARRGRARWVIGALAVALAVAALALASHRGVDGSDGLEVRLEDLGRVAVVGGDDLRRLRAEGATLVPARDVPGLDAALDGTDEGALTDALAAAHVGALLVDGRASLPDAPADAPEAPLRARLARYDAFEELQALHLARAAALYVPRTGLVVRAPLDEALAYVARALVGGARPPRVASFPEPLRRIRNVEVMIMLSEGGRPRLWRSARGSSIARALLTAASVARQRWSEREPAMGGALDAQLRTLDVDVYLLDEDGTLGDRAPAFLERAFTPAHGVAFDDLGTWRYLLPDATRERGEGSVVRAYHALFEDSDMPPESLARADVRLYRMLARRLARSPAPERAAPTDAALPLPSHVGPHGLDALLPAELP